MSKNTINFSKNCWLCSDVDVWL